MKQRSQFLFGRMVMFAVVASLCVVFFAGNAFAKNAKYVFLFIGDGMGIPQRTSAAQFIKGRLLMDSFPAQGVTTTYAADRFITGSAASATALAAGQKTNIGMIGMAPDTAKVKTVAEMARDKGQKVGIISSVSIDHATPAAFYAHVKKRSQYYDIDVALAESDFDFFGGGGLKDPTNKKNNSVDYKGNALDLIKQNGYKVVTDKNEFMSLGQRCGKVYAHNAWLQDSKALPYAIDTRPVDISLPEFTAKAIELLDNTNGFFLMVEGGKIDWACHANDGTAAIEDTLALDASINEAYKFYQKHPSETLIVVTGDHECGGLTLGFAGTKYSTDFDVLGKQKVSFQKFSDDMIKSLKEKNAGFDAAKPLITEYFGLKFTGDSKTDPLVLKPFELAQIKESFNRSMKGDTEKSKNYETYLLYGGYDPLAVTLTHILDQKAGLAWTSYKHTGVPVTTSAIGVAARDFNGYYDNTDVAKKLMKAMGIAPKVHSASASSAAVMAMAQ
jgi:alkaline phosphatase